MDSCIVCVPLFLSPPLSSGCSHCHLWTVVLSLWLYVHLSLLPVNYVLVLPVTLLPDLMPVTFLPYFLSLSFRTYRLSLSFRTSNHFPSGLIACHFPSGFLVTFLLDLLSVTFFPDVPVSVFSCLCLLVIAPPPPLTAPFHADNHD